jgi:hypothetical protein
MGSVRIPYSLVEELKKAACTIVEEKLE